MANQTNPNSPKTGTDTVKTPSSVEIKIDSSPSSVVAEVISSLDRAKKVTEPKRITQKKRQPRAVKVKEKPVKAKAAKRGRPKGSTSKKKTKKVVPVKVLKVESLKTKAPKTKIEPVKKPKNALTAAFTNIVLFSVVFAIVLIIQISLKSSEQKERLRVSPVKITEDVKLNNGEVKPEDADQDLNEQVEAQAKQDEQKDEPEIAKVEETKTETAPADEVKKEVEIKKEPDVAVKILKKTTKQRIKKYQAPPKESPYVNDPYTAGGPEDLDGPASREQYLATNVVKVVTNADAVKASKKTVPENSDTKPLQQTNQPDITNLTSRGDILDNVPQVDNGY